MEVVFYALILKIISFPNKVVCICLGQMSMSTENSRLMLLIFPVFNPSEV